jgi:asparagine synthase (glutamine-hydrolysing)
MCGIIAIAGKNTNKIQDQTIGEMLSCLSKRGPDEKAYIKNNSVILGQTRLSIVDIGGGKQPMKDSQHPFTLVFNGEIYDYKETRHKLEKHGHIFKTESDTEVILKAYAQYGRDCVNHLDGMFAFAMWDDIRQELFIARDRFGKKPFYYTFIDDTFFGASEIKSIFKTKLTKGIIDPQALNDYLRLLYIPPWKTIYSNIQMLPPASAAIIKNGNIEVWKYWKLSKKTIDISYDDAKKELKRLFSEAVRKRMIADVEIGSLLSGGVDSTLVTSYAAQYSKQPIKTFAVGFGVHKNELPYAFEASKKIHTDHHTLVAEKVDINELKEVIAYFDEPHADSSNFPQHLISKLASSKVKVALSGDGADELLMGYGWYQKHWHIPFFMKYRFFYTIKFIHLFFEEQSSFVF